MQTSSHSHDLTFPFKLSSFGLFAIYLLHDAADMRHRARLYHCCLLLSFSRKYRHPPWAIHLYLWRKETDRCHLHYSKASLDILHVGLVKKGLSRHIDTNTHGCTMTKTDQKSIGRVHIIQYYYKIAKMINYQARTLKMKNCTFTQTTGCANIQNRLCARKKCVFSYTGC